MGWSIGYDDNLKRDVGYGVPAFCDHPDCNKVIDRGISYVCGGGIFGGEHGCGMHFCGDHMRHNNEAQVCERCLKGRARFPVKPDHPKWIRWKLRDKSWATWRKENPEAVKAMRAALKGGEA
ncbi:hypothetical protein ACHMW6_06290 [Pseudoduganella sp. UC29_106]|uniref:hypothetical protein n=1 Tax=Pseudoduganella sp. UC29_106 TaxID=3374553 RepID=UPI003756F7A1